MNTEVNSSQFENKLTSLIINEMINKRVDALAEPDFLGSLFQRILTARNIDTPMLQHIINTYVSTTTPDQTPTENMFVRNNIHKELTQKQMTWNVFCKGLTILQYVESIN